MSDDDLIPLERDEADGAPEPAAPRGDWTRPAIAVAAVVAAVALVISAWAQVAQKRELEFQRCIQEAQAVAFGPLTRGDRQVDAYRAGLESCGVEVPTPE